jgi:hypothetical protein
MAKIDLKNIQKKPTHFFSFKKTRRGKKKEMETEIPHNFQLPRNNAITNSNRLIKALGSIWKN